jgi:hypothetical protein
VHCLRMRENARPLCLERRAFRSQNVRHSLLCCVFSESVSSIGTSTFCTKPPSAMAFSRMASFSGASGSFPSVTAAWRMTLCALRACYKFTCPVRFICSLEACLVRKAAVCTGSGRTRLVLLCSSLLMSCPYVVPTYWTSFSHDVRIWSAAALCP